MNKQIKRSPVEDWTLDRIIPYEHNAKLHPDSHVDQIAASIEEFTFLDPVAVDEKGEILEGHGRLLAAKQRGETTIPVIQITGMTEVQKVAYRLAHNKLTMNTGFDPDLLKIDFEFLKGEEFNLDLTGFEPVELEFLEGSGGGGTGGSDDDIPEVVESRVKPGEIWQLGRHYICCGDCTVEENVRKLLSFVGGRSPDMVWADPPYGIDIVKTKEGLGSTNGAKPFGSKENRGSVGAGNACAVGLYAPIAGDNSIDVAVDSYELCNKLMPNAIMFFWGGELLCTQTSS